ncbi:MAG: metallophosphoesterase, partial [Pseudomonadota bacterium]
MLQKLGAKTTASLRVLATSDLHGALTPYDYARGREQKGQNLAQLATLINQERASAQNSLLFDNGDFLEGSALADHAFAEFQTDPTAPPPIIAAMNVLGYDAVGLGNHEFDFGLPYLKTALSQANFPCLSSNLEVTSDLNPAHRQSIILSRDLITHDGDKTPIRLGVISLLPPPTLDWDAAELAGRVAIAETVATARTKADALRQVGVDLVIILAHTGLGRTLENAGSDLLDANLADVLVLGHKHEFHPNREAAAPIASNWVMPGFGGKALGVIDLDLTHNGTRWQVTNTHAHLKLSSDGVQSEPRVLDLVATAHRATTRKLDEVLTETETPLSAQFALTHPSAALTVIADAMRHGAQ